MSRVGGSVALTVLVVALAVALAVLVPWHGGPSGPVDVARDFTAADLARERAFHAALRPPAYLGLLLGLLVSAVLALGPWGARLVTLAGRPLGGGWAAQAGLGALAVSVLGRVAVLPLDARAEAVLRRYGLSTQSWTAWFGDWLKASGLAGLTTALLVLLVVFLARTFPRHWWGLAAALVGVFVVIASLCYPLVVEPLFGHVTPMRPGALRTALLDLAHRDGLDVREVLVADASRRTTTLNAYVSGFGRTRRVVLYDTLLASASDAEIEVVVAHEYGHAKRQDVLRGTVLGALAAAAGVCALALLLSWPALLARGGATGPGDPKVVALLLFLVAVGGLVVQPATNLVSRRVEARADLHAMQLTCDLPAFVAGERRLALAGLSDLDPPPLVYALFFTHPSSPQRIASARAYAAGHC